MAVDTRATTTITIAGTAYRLISATLTDESIQGSGLVRCRGNAVIAGTLTPAVGAVVRFSYTTATGTTRAIPRTLRVLSSFANPQTRETQIELGDKLIYLGNRKPAIKKINTREENNDLPCLVFKSATPPISAAYVVQRCLTGLGLTASSIPLTNRFSDDEYDLSAGYVAVIDELLLSESYFGSLDYSEVLQIRDLGTAASTGSLLTSADCIALSPIGTGALPGEAVAVSYDAKTFVPAVIPEEPDEAELDAQGWETEYSYGDKITIFETIGNTDVTLEYKYQEATFSRTQYDTLDRAKYRMVATNGYPTQRWEQTWWTYKTVARPEGDGTELAIDCIYEKTDKDSIVLSEYTQVSDARCTIVKLLNFDPDTFPTITSGGTSRVPVQKTFIRYNKSKNKTRTSTKQLVPWASTPMGAEVMRKQAKIAEEKQAQNPGLIPAAIDSGAELVSYGSHVKIRTERNFGLQDRPSQSERNAEALSRDQGTIESEVKLEWAYGSAISQDVVEFSLPKSPDDWFEYLDGSGYFYSPGDAQQKAQKFGRVQNAMLLGNRQGMGIQCSPLKLPPNPFDAFYVQIGGFNAQYRANGLQWNINATDVIASCDAMFWGAVGAASGTDISTSWVPLAPGTTTLPMTPVGTGTAGGTTVASDGTYGTVLTPGSVTLPYVETVRSDGVIRLYADEPTDPSEVFEFILSGEYVLTGNDIGALTNFVTINNGTYTLTGRAIAAALNYTDTVSTGTYTLTGNAIDAIQGFGKEIASGTYALTGNDIDVILTFVDTIANGTYTLTGNDVDVSGAFSIDVTIDNGTYVLTGNDVNGVFSFNDTITSGTYAITGNNIDAAQNFGDTIANGTYTLTGNNIGVTGTGIDPYFSSVSVLLHMNGSDTSTTITDSSSNAITVTAYGNAQISTAQSKFGGSSAYFDGTGDYLMSASSLTPLNMGTGDFTVEAFIRPTNNVSSYKGLIGISNADADTLYIFDGQLVWYNTGTFAGTIAVNNWYHVAASRQGSNLRVFIDGTLVNTSTNSNNITFGRLRIGSNGANNSEWFYGWMDEVRITKGVARYTANFTAPTDPFPGN